MSSRALIVGTRPECIKLAPVYAELIANTVAWVSYLCGFYPTADQIVADLDKLVKARKATSS